MPELPEVETSRRGIEPHIINTRVANVIVRNRSLRWPISKTVDRKLVGETITSMTRRAKYLLINTDSGSAILHLGMSGSVKSLGPEPLSCDFDARYLWEKSRGRRVSVKQFIMNAQAVVGVGNIYASEALFLACINPRRAAGRISLLRYERLVAAIKDVLAKAIKAGGTTLRDFYGGDGGGVFPATA